MDVIGIVLRDAKRAARAAGLSRIGCRHLAAALVRHDDVAAMVARYSGDPDRMRQALPAIPEPERETDACDIVRIPEEIRALLNDTKVSQTPLTTLFLDLLTLGDPAIDDATRSAGMNVESRVDASEFDTDDDLDLFDIDDLLPDEEGATSAETGRAPDPGNHEAPSQAVREFAANAFGKDASGASRSGPGRSDDAAAAQAGRVSKEQEEAARAVDRSIRDLSAAARRGVLDPVGGRTSEIGRMCEVLLRRRKSNILLVADPGVGKSSLVEGLAQHIVASDGALAPRPVLEVSLSGLVAGARYRGDFEARMEILIEQARERNAIVFFDEVHMLMGSGATGDRTMDGSNILKPSLARDDLSVIGATTPAEMPAIEADDALMRRFEVLHVREPGRAAMRDILDSAAVPFLDHHRVRMPAEIPDMLLRLADAYLPSRRFPDKAFDVLDGACVLARLAGRDTLSAEDVRHAIRQLGGTLASTPGAGPAPAARAARILDHLKSRIGGHDAALAEIAACAGRMGMQGGLMRIDGPPNVGRSTIVRHLADVLERPLIRVDAEDRAVDEVLAAIARSVRHAPDGVLQVRVGPGRIDPTILDTLATAAATRCLPLKTGRDTSIARSLIVVTGRPVGRRAGFSGPGAAAAARGRDGDGRSGGGSGTVLKAFAGADAVGALKFELTRRKLALADAGLLPDGDSDSWGDLADRVACDGYECWADVVRHAWLLIGEHNHAV